MWSLAVFGACFGLVRTAVSPEPADLAEQVPARLAASNVFVAAPERARLVRSTGDLRFDASAAWRRAGRRVAQGLAWLEQTQDPSKCHRGAFDPLQRAELQAEDGGSALVEAEGRVASFAGMKHVECGRRGWKDYREKFSNGGDPEDPETKHFFNVSLAECQRENTNVVWLYPSEDHNGAFDPDESVCGRLLGWYEEACSVHVWRIETVTQAQRVLEAYPDDSVMQATLGGHGADDAPEMQWGPSDRCGSGVLCARGQRSKRFLSTLQSKVAQHASILLDSCYGHASGLAKHIADSVGKGVKVIGGDNSFGAVTVGRFGPGYVVDDLEGAHVVEVLAEVGRACPAWAESTEADGDGDCKCPRGTECKTEHSGRGCPRSSGKFSRRHFDPGCATYGTCRCLPPRRRTGGS